MSAPYRQAEREASPCEEPLADLVARASVLDLAQRYTDMHKRGGKYWGCCPIHADGTPSFKVNPAINAWVCFGCPTDGDKHRRGDALDLVMAVERLSFGAACRRLRELVGTTGSDPRADAHRAARRAAAAAEEERDRARRAELALRVWSEAVPLPQDGDGEAQRYLHERRGIRSWLPHVLRWHPACPWGEETAGCIVAPVHGTAGEVVGVWRIRPTLEGKVKRWGLGPTGGGCCRLFDAAAEALVIAEGVEDALAARELTGWPAWAALNAGNMARLELPPPGYPFVPEEILIFADGDESGLAAARALATRLRADGRRARVVKPAGEGKDPNAVLLARRAA